MKKTLLSLISFLVLVSLTGQVCAMRDGRTAQGEPFLTGGIGSEERDALKVQRELFNVRMLTAAKGSGAFLSDVRARIADASGKAVLDVVMEGPWLYVNLLPGQYAVQVVYRGQTQQQNLTVGRTDQRSLNFYFNEAVERLPPGETR